MSKSRIDRINDINSSAAALASFLALSTLERFRIFPDIKTTINKLANLLADETDRKTEVKSIKTDAPVTVDELAEQLQEVAETSQKEFVQQTAIQQALGSEPITPVQPSLEGKVKEPDVPSGLDAKRKRTQNDIEADLSKSINRFNQEFTLPELNSYSADGLENLLQNLEEIRKLDNQLRESARTFYFNIDVPALHSYTLKGTRMKTPSKRVAKASKMQSLISIDRLNKINAIKNRIANKEASKTPEEKKQDERATLERLLKEIDNIPNLPDETPEGAINVPLEERAKALGEKIKKKLKQGALAAGLSTATLSAIGEKIGKEGLRQGIKNLLGTPTIEITPPEGQIQGGGEARGASGGEGQGVTPIESVVETKGEEEEEPTPTGTSAKGTSAEAAVEQSIGQNIIENPDQQQIIKRQKFKPELNPLDLKIFDVQLTEEYEEQEMEVIKDFALVPRTWHIGIETKENADGKNPLYNDNFNNYFDLRLSKTEPLPKDYQPPGKTETHRREGAVPRGVKRELPSEYSDVKILPAGGPVSENITRHTNNIMKPAIMPKQPLLRRRYRDSSTNPLSFYREPIAYMPTVKLPGHEFLNDVYLPPQDTFDTGHLVDPAEYTETAFAN